MAQVCCGISAALMGVATNASQLTILWTIQALLQGLGSAKTALMTRFLYGFPLFEALFRPVLGKLTLL